MERKRDILQTSILLTISRKDYHLAPTSEPYSNARESTTDSVKARSQRTPKHELGHTPSKMDIELFFSHSRDQDPLVSWRFLFFFPVPSIPNSSTRLIYYNPTRIDYPPNSKRQICHNDPPSRAPGPPQGSRISSSKRHGQSRSRQYRAPAPSIRIPTVTFGAGREPIVGRQAGRQEEDSRLFSSRHHRARGCKRKGMRSQRVGGAVFDASMASEHIRRITYPSLPFSSNDILHLALSNHGRENSRLGHQGYLSPFTDHHGQLQGTSPFLTTASANSFDTTVLRLSECHLRTDQPKHMYSRQG